MLSKDAFVARVTLRPCTRLLLSGPGAEPHPLLGVSRDCGLVINPVPRDVTYAIFALRPHAKVLYTSPWPSAGITGLDFIDCCVSRPFY